MGRGPDLKPRRPRARSVDLAGSPAWIYALQRWGRGLPYSYDVWMTPTLDPVTGHWQCIVAACHADGSIDPVDLVDLKSERGQRRSRNRRKWVDLSTDMRALLSSENLRERILAHASTND